MIRIVPSSIGGAVLGALALLPLAARAQMEQQSLVDRATLTVQDLMSELDRRRPGVRCCAAPGRDDLPAVLRVALHLRRLGFGLRAGRPRRGGRLVLSGLLRHGKRQRGCQIGIQDSEMMMMILTDKGWPP